MRKIQGDKSGIYSSDYKKNAENTNRTRPSALGMSDPERTIDL